MAVEPHDVEVGDEHVEAEAHQLLEEGHLDAAVWVRCRGRGRGGIGVGLGEGGVGLGLGLGLP